MANQAKIQQVDEVVTKLSQAKSAALVQYQGLDAANTASLRDSIRSQGGKMEVVKNTIIARALKKMGIQLPEVLTGPTSIAYSNEDEIAPLKEIDKVNKDKEVTFFKYGIYENKLLSVDELKTFLNLPSKSVLISRFVGGLANPLQRLVFSLKFNQTKLALVLKAIEAQKASQQ